MVVKKTVKVAWRLGISAALLAYTLSGCTLKRHFEKSDACNPPQLAWSELKQACVIPAAAADITINRLGGHAPAYAVFSQDRSHVEMFADDMPAGTILEAVKGGYVSPDGKIRLLRRDTQWKLVR